MANISWAPLMFGCKRFTYALIVCYVMIVFTALTIYYFYPIDKLSALILIPYFLWCCFASYLNLYIVVCNKSNKEEKEEVMI